ncbi:hypothetical protein Q604_UNBC01918G0001, partial [human gut metagenome]
KDFTIKVKHRVSPYTYERKNTTHM